jgi:hypothetical protein
MADQIDTINKQKEQYKLSFTQKSHEVNVLKDKLISEELKVAQIANEKTLINLKVKDLEKDLKISSYLRLGFAL